MRRTVNAIARGLCKPLRPARKFARDQRGATAIELGILGIPFFVLIAAVMESALIFFSSQVLDSAVQNASRTIRTGVAQTSGYNITAFTNSICSGLYGLFDCSKLMVKVDPVANFTTAMTTPVLDSNGNWALTPSYSPGAGKSVIMVQVYYKWPTIFNFAGFNMANTGDGHSRLLGAIRVFMNEPF